MIYFKEFPVAKYPESTSILQPLQFAIRIISFQVRVLENVIQPA